MRSATLVKSIGKRNLSVPQSAPVVGTESYVGTLIAKDLFTPGNYNMAHLDIPNEFVMTANAGAWMSEMVSVNTSTNTLDIGMKTLVSPITVTRNDGSVVTAYKEGGYVVYRAPGLVRRGGVWIWESAVPASSYGWGMVPLLWPDDDNWPSNGEIDGIPELFSGSATKFGGQCYVHWSSGFGATNTEIQQQLPASGDFGIDWTAYHKCAVSWNPGLDDAGTGCWVRFYVDDVLVAETTDPTYVPHGVHTTNMRLTFQTEGYGVDPVDSMPGPLYWKIKSIACYTLP